MFYYRVQYSQTDVLVLEKYHAHLDHFFLGIGKKYYKYSFVLFAFDFDCINPNLVTLQCSTRVRVEISEKFFFFKIKNAFYGAALEFGTCNIKRT